MDNKYQKKAIQGILDLGVNIRTNDNLHSKLILIDKKVNDEHQFVLILQEVLKEKVERGDVISYQGVAKTLLESLPPKETMQSPDQQLWTLTRNLMDNARCKAILDTEIEKYQQRYASQQQGEIQKKKRRIKNIVIRLSKYKRKFTIQEIHKLTGYSKRFLYSDEIKQFIATIQQETQTTK